MTEEAELAVLYKDLHAHPELAFAEHRTAAVVAARLRDLGYEVTEGVGRTGVVGVMRNGDGADGPAARRHGRAARQGADRPAVREHSQRPRPDGRRPVMHACGHDVHVTCLLGAAAELAADPGSWRGTLLLVFQPAEETGEGARAMIDDGLFDRFGAPGVVLGQHVAPIPAGLLGLRAGPRSPPRTRCASCCTGAARTARGRRRRSTRS